MYKQGDRQTDRQIERWGTRLTPTSTVSTPITVYNVLRTFPEYFPKTWNYRPLSDHRNVSFPTGVRSTNMNTLPAFATTKPTKDHSLMLM